MEKTASKQALEDLEALLKELKHYHRAGLEYGSQFHRAARKVEEIAGKLSDHKP